MKRWRCINYIVNVGHGCDYLKSYSQYLLISSFGGGQFFQLKTPTRRVVFGSHQAHAWKWMTSLYISHTPKVPTTFLFWWPTTNACKSQDKNHQMRLWHASLSLYRGWLRPDRVETEWIILIVQCAAWTNLWQNKSHGNGVAWTG